MRPISGKLQTFLEEKCDVFNYISVWGRLWTVLGGRYVGLQTREYKCQTKAFNKLNDVMKTVFKK